MVTEAINLLNLESLIEADIEATGVLTKSYLSPHIHSRLNFKPVAKTSIGEPIDEC